MSDSQTDPLTRTAPTEIPLKNAPIVSAISQVRFPERLSIADKSFVAPFQEALHDDYPRFEETRLSTIKIDGSESQQIETELIWKFVSGDENWRVSLGSSFVAIETSCYTSRTDFIERLGKILAATENVVNPQIATRLGVRYINRIENDHIDEIEKLIEPYLVGITPSLLGEGLQSTVCEARCKVAEGGLTAKWGFVPPKGTHDPALLPPSDLKTWVLDIDVYNDHLTSEEQAFDADKLTVLLTALAEREYNFFRWCVSPDFLKLYGGDV